MSPQDPRWQEYYSVTKSLPPSKLLVQALGYVETGKKAIDIGAGALKDTRYLLEQGFEVTAIDKEPISPQLLIGLDTSRLRLITTAFDDFEFPIAEYDLACSMFALPFNEPNSFSTVLQAIKNSLKEQGIFCGQLFGVNDDWRASRHHMTFHTKEQVDGLFSDMEMIYFNEEEKDGLTASGTPKHWHIFNIIAKKVT